MKKKIFVKPYGYHLMEFIGEGLNSCVYRAFKEDSHLGVKHEVALKILKSEKQVAIWRSEFESLSKVRSPYCVSLLGWEVIEGRPALVLEYVKGVTLADLKNWGELSENDINEICSQARLGLIDLDSAGLFHGDLSLFNILVDEMGGVKLVDFGVFAPAEGLQLTLKYAAPSVISGERPNYDSDMLSLQLIRAELEEHIGKNSKQSIHELEPLPHSRSSLVTKVERASRIKAVSRARTQALDKNAVGNNIWPGLSQTLLICFLTLFSLLSRGDRPKEQFSQPMQVSVRSSGWVRVSISGRSMRYAPFDEVIESKNKISIIWESARGRGQTSLTAKSGEHIVLGDSFFGGQHDFR